MKTVVALVASILVLAPGGYALNVTQQKSTLEARVVKLEKKQYKLEKYHREGMRQVRLLQDVLYLKQTGLLPEFLNMKMRMEGFEYSLKNLSEAMTTCFRYRTDYTAVIVSPCIPNFKPVTP